MKFPQSPRQPLRTGLALLLTCLSLSATAQVLYWDGDGSSAGNLTSGAGLGGAGVWNQNGHHWWDLSNVGSWVNTGAAEAVFTGLWNSTAPSTVQVTLADDVSANRLTFQRSHYELAGSSLLLAGEAPTLHAYLGTYTVIDSLLEGTNGLVKTGGGAVRLGNVNNTYSGITSINNGSLIISSPSALGTSSVEIIGNSTRGFGGGALVLDGLNGGMNLTLDINMRGYGPIADRSAALLSLGTNELSGALSTGNGAIHTRFTSIGGRLTLSGSLTAGGTAATTVTGFGSAANATGTGSYHLTGSLAGVGILEKTGSGTLIFDPSDSRNFSGTVRVGSSATGTTSSIRIISENVLGTRVATGTASVLDFNTGTLEVRMDAPSLNAGGQAANVYLRNTSTLFVDHAIGSEAIGGKLVLGALSFEDNYTFTISGRNGYSVAFTGPATVIGGDNNSTFTNSLNGTLSFTGDFWNNFNNTANRTLTLSGAGDTILYGSIIASAANFDHHLTKSSGGTLTLLGTATTLDGNININAGTLAIGDFRAINNNTATINIGSSTTGSIFSIVGFHPNPADLTTSKVINLAGTTGGATILANQTGSAPVIFNANFTATGGTSANAKTLTLGGTNTADNTINGNIPNNAAGGLVNVTKIDAGTWVLAGANTYTGTTTISNGTLKLKANAATSTVLGNGNAITFTNTSNNYAGGTLEFVGQPGVNNVQSLGVLTTAAGANTIKVTPGEGGTASLVFANLATSSVSTLNIVGADFVNNQVTLTLINGNAGNNGLIGRTIYWNGADFAYREGGVLRAPVYGSDSGFATSSTNLTASANQEITGSFATNTISLSTLKIQGNQTLSINAGQTLTLSAGGLLATDGHAEISGGTLALGSQALVVRVNQDTDTLHLNSSLTGSGGLTKVGQGTLILSGVSAITGSTVISEGTVRLSGTAVLSGNNSSTSIRQNAVLDLNGVSTGSAISTFVNVGLVTNSSNTTVTLTIGNNNGTGNSYGIIEDGQGIVNVTKLGSGAQIWGGLSTYSGVTTISSTGVVSVPFLANLGEASGIGRGDINNNAGSLIFNGASSSQAYGGLSYTGRTTISIDRLFTFGGTAANSGARIQANGVNNAAMIWSNPGALAFGTSNIAQGLVLGGASTGDNTFHPQITDNGTAPVSVYKSDAGVWILANPDNSYSGITQINAGTLIAQNGASLPTASNLVLNGGVFASSGTLSRDVGSGADQFRFLAPAADTAKFAGGFAASLEKLTVTWDGTPVWGGTSGFLDTRNGLILSSAFSLDEVEIAGNFSLGSAPPVSPASVVVNTSSGSATVTLTEGTTSNLVVGQVITGANIPAGAYITSITNATTITISSSATATATGTTATLENSRLRTIRVDDNTSTGTDFATITGVISGEAGTGLRKTGAGMLQLLGANTYDGVTSVHQGTLVVNSLGNSLVGGASSVGLADNAHLESNAITLGNTLTTGATLQYIGPGETSDRMIRLNTTTGGNQIHADGSGPLILTNVLNNMAPEAKTLSLRGTNTAGNMITSQLTDNSGALSITVDGGATWILTNPNNSFSGTVSINAGALGVGSDTALGTALISFNNGSIFAYGDDRTLANPLDYDNNTTMAFVGDHSLTFTGTLASLASANNITTTNNIVAGKTLSFKDVTANAMTAARTWSLNGAGHTIISGNITSTTAYGFHLSYTGNGRLTLLGANNTTKANTTVNNNLALVELDGSGKLGNGNLTVNAGTLNILTTGINQSVELLTMGGGSSGSSSVINIGSGRTLAITGYTFSATNNNLTANINGPGTLSLGSSNITATVGNSTAAVIDAAWNVGTLTGSGNFTKDGAGTLDLGGITNHEFTGSYILLAGAIQGIGTHSNNISLNGGVYEGSGTFSRALGTGANQIQWANSSAGGGFSAYDGDLTVSITGVAGPLVWGSTASFVTSSAPLLFGSTSANHTVTFTNDINLNNGTRTVQVNDNTASTADKAVLSGVLSNGSLNKTGTGILELAGANTFSGGLTITQGTLQFRGGSNVGDGSSNLGLVTSITLAGGTLSFIGNTDQNVGRAISTTASSTLSADGTDGAIITFSAAITQASNNLLTLIGTGSGVITGGITQGTGTTADLTVNSGNWTITGANSVIADDLLINGGTLTIKDTKFTLNDDVIVTGVGTTLNLNSTGVLAGTTPSGTSNNLYARNGGVININAPDIYGVGNSGGLDSVLIGDATAGADAILNLNGYNLSFTRLDVGQVATDLTGIVNGTGTITLTSSNTAWEQGFRFFRGEVHVNLAGNASMLKQGAGEVILTGDNSGLNGNVAATRLDAGTLTLDYATHNTSKISPAAALDLRGATLHMKGNADAATSQTTSGLTLNAGSSQIVLESRGQAVSLTVGGITRAANSTLNLQFTPGTGHLITTAENANGTLLGGWATVNRQYFATVQDGEIAPFTSTIKNNLADWQALDDVTDSTGYTGTLTDSLQINSLLFQAAAGSTVNLGSSANILRLASGGILITPDTGASVITGGTLLGQGGTAGTELLIHQNSESAPLRIESSLVGANTLTKAGAGVLELSGRNSYRGITNINEGTLRFVGGMGASPYSAINLKNIADVQLDIDNGTVFIGGLAGGGTTGGVVHIGTGTLIVNTAQAARVYAGLITGSGTFIKTGPNTQEIEGTNTNFTGHVIINAGLLHLDTTYGRMHQALTFTLNAAELLDDQDQSSNVDRIGNNARVILNNTAQSAVNAATIRGFWLRNDGQNAVRADTIGAVVLGAGHNIIQATNTGGAAGSSQLADLIITQFLREGRATALVRGQALGGGTTGARALIRPATIPAGAIGGGATSGMAISIIPYLIGANIAASAVDADVALENGNTFVTWVSSTQGFRPLDLTNEYVLNETGYNSLAQSTANNVRFAAQPTGVLASGSKTFNSLVLDSSTAALTLTGNSQSTLTLGSGALLATTTTAANAITLTGFAALQTNTDEYLIYVTNPANTLTLDVPLTSQGAGLTKSGNGTLVLTSPINSYGGGTWFNQGFIEVAELNALGSGNLNFFGGGLRWAAGADFDPSIRPMTFSTGGAILDTNGNDVSFSYSIGNHGNGGLTKIGEGRLTFYAPATFKGTLTVAGGAAESSALILGVPDALPAGTSLALGTNSGTLGGYFDYGGYDLTLGDLNVNVNSVLFGFADLTFTGNVAAHGSANRTLTVNSTGQVVFDGDLMTLVDRGTSARTFTLTGNSNIIINSQIVDGTASANLSISNNGTTRLTGYNTYSGTTTINVTASGTVIISRGQSLGLGTALTLSSGTLMGDGSGSLIISQNVTLATGTTTLGGSDAFVFNGTWLTSGGTRTLVVDTTGGATLNGVLTLGETTNNRTQVFSGSGNIRVNGVIQNNSNAATPAGALTYLGTGTLTLAGNNTYTGTTTLGSSTVAAGRVDVLSGSKISSAALTILSGQLHLFNGAQAITTLTLGNGPLGSSVLVDLHNGTLSLGGNVTYTTSTQSGPAILTGGTVALGGARTFTINDSTQTDVELTVNAVLADGDVESDFIKAGVGVLVFEQANTYTGTTSLNNGTLRFQAAQTMTGGLQFGSTNATTSAGRLEILENVTFPSLVAQTNSSTNASHLYIAENKTLTITGNVTIGSGSTSNTTTLLNASGGGTLVVNNLASNALFSLGGTNNNRATADFSALAALQIQLNASNGIVQIGSTTTNSATSYASILKLAQDTQITAKTITVGAGGLGGSTTVNNKLVFGSTSTLINTDTLNIGTGSRDMGWVGFESETGSVTIRSANGSGATTLFIGTGSSATGSAGTTNTFDVRGHHADLTFGAVSIGTQNRAVAYDNYFGFDTGTLSLINLTMSTRTSNTSTNGAGQPRVTNSTFEIGGGTVSIANGILAMASAAGSNTTTNGENPAPIVNATLNISGGTVSIGATSGIAINMASYTANGDGSANAEINITGGSVTVAGDIRRLTSSANTSAVINLDGGSLNMSGHAIGTATHWVMLNAFAGTLSNLGQLNGGGLLYKSSPGILHVTGTNTYSGETYISEGAFVLDGTITGAGTFILDPGATLAGSGVITLADDHVFLLDGDLQVGAINDTEARQLTLTTTGFGQASINGRVTLDLFGGQQSGTLNGSQYSDMLIINSTNGIYFGSESELYVTANIPIGESWTAGTQWKLFDWSGLTNGWDGVGAMSEPIGFASLHLPDISAFGLAWDISQLYSQGTLIVVVPEPSRALLLLMGLLFLSRRRRLAKVDA